MDQDLFLQLLDVGLADARVCFRVSDRDFCVGRARPGQAADACDVTIRVHNARFFSRVLCYGNLGMGEAFIDQDFEIEQGTLHDFLTILLRNRLPEKINLHPRLTLKVLATRLVAMLRGKQGNVQRHYDLGDDLFESFLDTTLTYSCGYVQSREDDLEQLQRNKLDRIARKLRLQSGDHLLDIGCGYGGLLLYAALHFGITGVGVTISRRHCERGNARIAQAGLSDRVRIQSQDFRSVAGQFDKIVSVGMMEHVPRREYTHYFQGIARALRRGGLGLVHTIGSNSSKNEHDPFIQKYIFPGSNQPRLSEIALHLERCRLAILDVENMVRHYAHTVLCWLRRFQENQAALDTKKYDAAFRRLWEYYFSCGIAAARASDSAVYQVLFTNDYAAEIPLERI